MIVYVIDRSVCGDLSTELENVINRNICCALLQHLNGYCSDVVSVVCLQTSTDSLQ